jgi:hypothetical protein
MSLIFSKKLAFNKQQARMQLLQWNELQAMRMASNSAVTAMLKMAANAGRSPEEAFREFDSTTKIELVPFGEHATLSRVMQKSRSVDIGKTLFEYRKSSDTDVGQSSMSGQTGVKMNHVDYSYGGAVVPIHDKGYGRTWRDMKAMQSEGFDALVDDARESERKLMTTIGNYMWDGDASLVVKGNKWLGLRNDPTVASATLGLDLALAASTATAIRDEIRRVRDILFITNNCTQGLRLGISREIASNWERVFSTSEGIFGDIRAMIGRLRGIVEIYEDSELVGNQLTMFWDDQQGFHPVVGMAISSYAVQRINHNDDFNFIKWAGVGFLSKTDFSSRKCALYGA